MAKKLIEGTALAIRLALAALFLYAGAIKIWDWKTGASATPGFFEDVMNFQLTSWDISMAIAVYLPWLEVITALALLPRRFRLGALSILAVLSVVFLGALTSAWHRGLDISCGCFGRETIATDFPVVITRDLLLLAAIAFALWAEAQRARSADFQSAVPPTSRRPPPAD